MHKVILIGGGGHCKSCIDVVEQQGKYQVAGIVDLPGKMHQTILGYEIISTDDDLPDLVKEYGNFLITLGQIKNPEKRIRIFQTLKESGVKLSRRKSNQSFPVQGKQDFPASHIFEPAIGPCPVRKS